MSKLVEQVCNQWDGILILHGHFVEGSVIDAESK